MFSENGDKIPPDNLLFLNFRKLKAPSYIYKTHIVNRCDNAQDHRKRC